MTFPPRRPEVVAIRSTFKGTAAEQMAELVSIVKELQQGERARLDLKPADGEEGRKMVSIWVERHADTYFDSQPYNALTIAASRQLRDNWGT